MQIVGLLDNLLPQHHRQTIYLALTAERGQRKVIRNVCSLAVQSGWILEAAEEIQILFGIDSRRGLGN